jgi:hypothetical protein
LAAADRISSHQQEEGEKLLTQANMKTPIEYIIVAVPFHADAATHDELARKVNEKLSAGYELVGAPFLSEEMMYQAMTRTIIQTSPLPAS